MGKNYKLWNTDELVKIIFSHSDDLGKVGIIREVRPSFCKIEIQGYPKLRNHTYGQFERVSKEEFDKINALMYYKCMTEFPQVFKDRLAELQKLFETKKLFKRSALYKTEIEIYKFVLCCFDTLKEIPEVDNLEEYLKQILPYYSLDSKYLDFAWNLFKRYYNGEEIITPRINDPSLY